MIDDPLFQGRIEGRLKAAGAAVFAAETAMPGLLHAALVEVPIARGEVLEVEADVARRCPGVVDVVGRAEAVAMLRPVGALGLILAPHIHFAGQAVALVVAVTSEQARDGAGAVRVRWSEAPPVALAWRPELRRGPTRPTCAAPGPRRLQPARRSRRRPGLGARRGARALRHHRQQPSSHGAACGGLRLDREWAGRAPGRAHLHPGGLRDACAVIAHAFGLPPEAVRVVSTFLGGGFGCKGQLWWPWMMLAILAARRTGRPVRLELTRAQLFTLAGRRSATVQDLALGADAQGRIVAIDHQVLAQTSTHAPEYADPVAMVSRWTYACPNVRTGHWLARTNEPQPIPMRGLGEAPGSFALESALNELAERLGIDPVELRLKNIAPIDQETGLPWSSNGLAECLKRRRRAVRLARAGPTWLEPRREAFGSAGAWPRPPTPRGASRAPCGSS